MSKSSFLVRLAAILLLFKERAFVEASIRAIYPVVDSICCTSQHDRNFAGAEIAPDSTLETLLRLPDPENKIRLVVQRDLHHVAGKNSEARLRNAAMALDPQADYYLIVDTDEIWPLNVLHRCWEEVQKTQWAAYRVSSDAYFRTWNYRIVEAGEGYRPLVFVRNGFPFSQDRQIHWQTPERWKEYLRTGRKPKTVYFPSDLRVHHGSCVGDDERILTKLKNYGHAQGVDPGWYDRIWKNFDPTIRHFHYFHDRPELYESLVHVPSPELPEEVTRCSWPLNWIER